MELKINKFNILLVVYSNAGRARNSIYAPIKARKCLIVCVILKFEIFEISVYYIILKI
jgi:hypothetical protein